MDTLLQSAGAWFWLILGLVLIGLELLVPGGFLVWLGVAALVTGAIAGLIGVTWQTAVLVFVALSLAAAALGRYITRGWPSGDADDMPDLNRRAQALIGRVLVLERPIVGGEGRVRIGDSSWRVTGPDAPLGAGVRVVRIEGTTLVVEPA